MVMGGDDYGQKFSDVHPLKTALDFSTLGVMVIGDLSFSISTIMTLGKILLMTFQIHAIA